MMCLSHSNHGVSGHMKVEGEHIAEEHLSQALHEKTAFPLPVFWSSIGINATINCLFVALRRQATIREITSTGPNGHCRTPTIMNLGMYTVCTQSQVNCAMKIYEMCYATQVRCSIGFIRVLARGKAPSSQRSTLGTRTWTVSDRVCEITAAQLFQSMASLKTALAREPNRTRSCQQLPTTRTLVALVQQNHFSRCQTFRKDKCFKNL